MPSNAGANSLWPGGKPKAPLEITWIKRVISDTVVEKGKQVTKIKADVYSEDEAARKYTTQVVTVHFDQSAPKHYQLDEDSDFSAWIPCTDKDLEDGYKEYTGVSFDSRIQRGKPDGVSSDLWNYVVKVTGSRAGLLPNHALIKINGRHHAYARTPRGTHRQGTGFFTSLMARSK